MRFPGRNKRWIFCAGCISTVTVAVICRTPPQRRAPCASAAGSCTLSPLSAVRLLRVEQLPGGKGTAHITSSVVISLLDGSVRHFFGRLHLDAAHAALRHIVQHSDHVIYFAHILYASFLRNLRLSSTPDLRSDSIRTAANIPAVNALFLRH